MAHAAELAAWEGSLELFRLLANSVPAMIAYYDAPENGQRCRFANRAYAAAFGLTEATIIGKSFPEVIGEEAAREVQPSIDEVVQHSRTVAYVRGRSALDFIAPDQVARVVAVLGADEELSYESVILHKNGTRIPVEFIGRTLVYENERLRMSVVRDLRDRHAAQARIHHLAHHDALTGLPNRVSFMERLSAHIELARLGSLHLALLFIDLDHFKRVNDSLGHLVGDTLLQTVAARITASLRATDIVARFGGDEFMVLLPGIAQRSDVEEVAQKLLLAIEAPVNAEDRPISVTASAGVALFPHDGDSPQELI